MVLRRRLAAAVALGVVAGTVPVGAVPAGQAVASRPEPGAWRADGRVLATAIVGDVVYVGGTFTRITGPRGQRLPRRHLAAFSLATGAPVPGWRVDTSAVVRALETDGTSLWVGGYFDRVAGVARRGLARLDPVTGAVDEGFEARMGGGVEDIDVDGRALYVGGRFSRVAGVKRRGVAKLAAGTGALVTQFAAGLTSPVFALRADPVKPRLYVGGPFSAVGGAEREGAAVLDARTGRLRPVRLAGSRRPTLSLDVSSDGSRVYGGDGGNWATAWRASDGTRVWARHAWGNVQAIRRVQGRVYFGFHEGYKGRPQARVLAVDARTGRLARWYPRFRGYWGVFAIAAHRRYLVVGGQFDRVTATRARGWARFTR